MEDLRHFDPALEPGGAAVLTLAQRIADEVGSAAGKKLQVLGWSGPVIHRGWEYLVEMDGKTLVFDVAENDIRSFQSTGYDQADLERHLRGQLSTLVKNSLRG